MGRTTRLHGFDVEFEAFDLYDAHFAAFGDIGGRDSAPEFAVNADLPGGMTWDDNVRHLPDHRFGSGLWSPASSQPEAPGELAHLDPKAREDHDQIPWPWREEQREKNRDG